MLITSRRTLIQSIFGFAAANTVVLPAFGEELKPVEYPIDPGSGGLQEPRKLAGTKNKFPIPPNYYARAKLGSYCETTNVDRAISVTQWSADASSSLQSAQIVYTGDPGDAGFTKELSMDAVSAPTWIVYQYSFEPTEKSFRHDEDKLVHWFEAKFPGRGAQPSDAPEGKLLIGFSKNKATLDSRWNPPF